MSGMDERAPGPGTPARERITSHDVARVAGVSQSTVSRALRQHPSISTETRERVLAAVEALRYTPSELGRSLVTQSTKTIGMVVTDLENPFYPHLIAPLHDGLSTLGYRMLLVTDTEDADVSQHFLGRSVDGVVLTTTTLDSPLPAQLGARGVPFVFLTREADGIATDAAVVDNTLGASIMASEVLGQGHSRIGALLGPTNTSTGRDRERGLRVTLAAQGVPLEDDAVRHGPFVAATGYAGMYELMALHQRPSVVICGNDSIAIGALNAARALALSVPGDVSIVGFDDLPLAGWEIVQLTTVHQPMTEMARTAARLLVDRVEGRTEPGRTRREVFEPKLVIRSTLAPPS